MRYSPSWGDCGEKLLNAAEPTEPFVGRLDVLPSVLTQMLADQIEYIE